MKVSKSPWLFTKLNLYYFEFRFLISNIDIYPFYSTIGGIKFSIAFRSLG